MANYNDGKVRNGSSIGSGSGIGNIKDGRVRDGSSLGSGRTIGKVDDFVIKGMEKRPDAEIVVAYHFLIKNVI